MNSRITQYDIARKVGVSQRTVASVVGRSVKEARVRPELRERILKTARELGYRPHRGARLMKGVRSGLIGSLSSVSVHEHQVSKELLLGNAVVAHGYEPIFIDMMWDRKGLTSAIDFLQDIQVEGLLIANTKYTFADTASFEVFRQADIPVVRVDRPEITNGMIIHSVVTDNEQGMTMLVEHLLARGFRRIAMVVEAATPFVSSQARVAAYDRTMRLAGLAPDLIMAPAHSDAAGLGRAMDMGRWAMEQLLQRKQRPEAVCFQNDLFAAGALVCCLRHGVDVPGEIALAGFDNHSVARHMEPPITSVEQPVAEIAEQAVDLLVRLIRDEADRNHVHNHRLPCRLHPRASTGDAW